MKHLIAVMLFLITAFIISLSITSTAEAGPCNRKLDYTIWECNSNSGNCCDDVPIYG